MIDNELKARVERIERLEQEENALKAEKRHIYAGAKDAGYNPKALRRIIAERRMKDREQIEADMRAYRIALGMAVNDVANGASVREASAKHGIPKSTIHDAVRREEKTEIGQSADDGMDIPPHLQRPRPSDRATT
jgi:uncharacterized protein (UPF0335 family)